jgi:AAA domain
MSVTHYTPSTARQCLKITRLLGQGEPSRRRAMKAYKKFASVTKGSDFMNTPRPTRRWAVHGLIPEGLSFIAAGKSVGKSWLALNIAL